MQIVYEEGDADYEQYQALLMEEVVRSVRQRLEAAGIKGMQLRELVTNIAFDVGAIVDGSQMVTTEDDHLAPFLGFAEGRMRDGLLLSHGGGASSLHEFVPGIVEDEFEGSGSWAVTRSAESIHLAARVLAGETVLGAEYPVSMTVISLNGACKAFEAKFKSAGDSRLK